MIRLLFVLLVACLPPAVATAADRLFVRPLKWVIPFPAGGAGDMMARTLAPDLSAAIDVPVLIENQGGAQGAIASATVARAKPDGHTILLGFLGSMAQNPWAYNNIGYDPLTDLEHVTLLSAQPLLIASGPKLGVTTLQEMVALARSRSKAAPISYASTSLNSRLTGVLVSQAIGATMMDVAYKGGGPALNDVLGGHVEMMYVAPATVLGPVRDGKLRGLAVTGPTRLPALPDVPTVAEAGFPALESVSWYSIAAPKGTPAKFQERLAAEFAKILTRPEIKEKLRAAGFEALTSSPTETVRYVRAEHARWGKIVQSSGISKE
ncbi:Bug family tripartite tricarboxylate transporter substrate binding protein [Hydrogenophaga sp. BPS33]|uniref:Bug family tripartite tricarboxylate transporter substrate binding protein n=1 Tax=Hydrogenophaga sp. BPS33 TaxID=2651974 RepID=UPI00135B40A5|nr:tripartite tricarboxylate transporter substrate binding protein [Hydrogenophaga sp. BPS33]